MKLPALQFYVGDWRKDTGVQSLSYHDRGVWFEILCFMHESEDRGKLILNGKAMSDECIARLLGLDNQNFKTTLTTLLTNGVADRDAKTGALMSRRMVRDENIRKVRQEAGKLGGNPILLNQNSTTEVKQIPTPSSSLSITEKDKNRNLREIDDMTRALTAKTNAIKPSRLLFDRECLRLGLDADATWMTLEMNGWIDKKGQQIGNWKAYINAMRIGELQR